MKKTILLISYLTLYNSFAFSQVVDSVSKKYVPPSNQTTFEEYNYMTKGFPIQLTSGLDMKKGYSVSEPVASQISSYSFWFRKLYRLSGGKKVIGYIVFAHSNVSGKDYWFGLPMANEELTELSFQSIRELDDSMTTAFFMAFTLYVNK
jgi:hypothetical protein